MTRFFTSFNEFFFGGIKTRHWSIDLVVLLARLFAGYTIMTAGLDKLPLPNWMTEQVSGMGFPFPVLFAWLASWIEFAFGCLLLLGLMTRFSAGLLAIVLGVAAFGFHKVIPLGEMHITQLYFWIFMLFSVIGAGKYSFDHYIYHSELNFRQKLTFTGIPSIIVLLALGLYLESGPQKDIDIADRDFKIESIHIASNFNNWDPAALQLETMDSINYFKNISFDKPTAVQFKFTTNQSWSYNLGDTDQSIKGFPASGTAEPDNGTNNKNIETYIPMSGTYRFNLNINDFIYSIDTIK